MAQFLLQQSTQFSKDFANPPINPGTTLMELKNSQTSVVIATERGRSYRVIDADTGQIQSVKKILRKNQDLYVELQSGPTLEFQDFYPKGPTIASDSPGSEFVISPVTSTMALRA